MLGTLLSYPDHPYDWQTIGYYEGSDESANEVFVPVVTPKNLDRDTIRPKEQALLDTLKAEKEAGRQSWVLLIGISMRHLEPAP